MATRENREEAVSLVRLLARLNPRGPHIEQVLRRTAALTLCKRYHRIEPAKHDEVVHRWMLNIRLAIRTGPSNPQSARTRLSINAYTQPQRFIQNPRLENAETSPHSSEGAACQQCQQRLGDILELRAISEETELEHGRLRNELGRKDEEIVQLRHELAEKQETISAQSRERQIQQDHYSREYPRDEEVRQEQDREDLRAEEERRRNEELRHQKLQEEIEAERKVNAEREIEAEARISRLDSELQGERKARQELQGVIFQQNEQQNKQEEDHRQEQQRLQECLERLQDSLQSFQEHALRLQDDRDRAHRELARRYRDTNADSPPPEAPATSVVGRLRRRIGQRLSE